MMKRKPRYFYIDPEEMAKITGLYIPFPEWVRVWKLEGTNWYTRTQDGNWRINNSPRSCFGIMDVSPFEMTDDEVVLELI